MKGYRQIVYEGCGGPRLSFYSVWFRDGGFCGLFRFRIVECKIIVMHCCSVGVYCYRGGFFLLL